MIAIVMVIGWLAGSFTVFGIYTSDLDAYRVENPPAQTGTVVLNDVQRQELLGILTRIEVHCAELIHEATGRTDRRRELEEACAVELRFAEQQYLTCRSPGLNITLPIEGTSARPAR